MNDIEVYRRMGRPHIFIIMMISTLCACGNRSNNSVPVFHSWDAVIRHVGTSSSPRAADLTGDGILDIVMGAGKVEFQHTDSAVIALNGADGTLLWTAPARDQPFGAAAFMDITGDEVPDVFIGGRSSVFMAIDGDNGEVLWEFMPPGDSVYNFYNPQFIRDADGDGLGDIVVAHGGYARALPSQPQRPAGKLMVLSAKTGATIAEAVMPDGKETYMSCVLLNPASEDPTIIFGTGGERIPGNLYRSTLRALLQGDLATATILASGGEKGFVAPPVMADITGDGVTDVIANAVEGRMMAIDGKTWREIWNVFIPGTEAYCSIAIGNFDGDGIPDFFTNFGIGVFPNLMRSYQLAISGKQGKVLRKDSLGSFHYGSAVVCNIDIDSLDEVFYHINLAHYGMVKNVVKIFDIQADTVYDFSKQWNGANIASTPLLTDMDKDGYLDIVYTHENNPADLLSLKRKTGLVIHAVKTEIGIGSTIPWASYMGSAFDGTYRAQKK